MIWRGVQDWGLPDFKEKTQARRGDARMLWNGKAGRGGKGWCFTAFYMFQATHSVLPASGGTP